MFRDYVSYSPAPGTAPAAAGGGVAAGRVVGIDRAVAARVPAQSVLSRPAAEVVLPDIWQLALFAEQDAGALETLLLRLRSMRARCLWGSLGKRNVALTVDGTAEYKVEAWPDAYFLGLYFVGRSDHATPKFDVEFLLSNGRALMQEPVWYDLIMGDGNQPAPLVPPIVLSPGEELRVKYYDRSTAAAHNIDAFFEGAHIRV